VNFFWVKFLLKHFREGDTNPQFRLIVSTSITSFSGPDVEVYRGVDKSFARPTCRCILFDGENVSFDASLVVYINNINIPPIMIINRVNEYQNLLSL